MKLTQRNQEMPNALLILEIFNQVYGSSSKRSVSTNYAVACRGTVAKIHEGAVQDAKWLLRFSGVELLHCLLCCLCSAERDGIPIGPKAPSDSLHVYPRGLRDLLLLIKGKYNNPLIYITENGIDEVNDDKLSLEEALNDKMRVQYHHDHLTFLHLAIKEGVKVKGYFAWSLLDNFEWSSGYTLRFGINYVDYKNGLKRYPKLSAHWFKRFLQRRY